ncbi:MAG: O-antigen ligase family protein [Bacteroidota bacterium]
MQLFTGKWPPRYTSMYFISLALLVGSLPLSKFTMSLFQFSTLFFWLRHGVDTTFFEKYPASSLFYPLKLAGFLGQVIKAGFKALVNKFVEFFRNKPAMAIASVFLLHIIGLIYTTDFNYALKDLRTKLPLFILPLFIATGPRISTRTFYWIMACLVAAVFGGSIYRLVLYLNLPQADSRALSAHTSHIRYSLNAVFAVFILFFFMRSNEIRGFGLKTVMLLVALWLVAFMVYMNYSTGILLFLFISLLLLVIFAFRIKNPLLKTALLALMVVFTVLPLLYVLTTAYKYINTPPVEFSKLDKYTPNGNSYYHDTVNFKPKNGKWAGLYICDKELREAWARRSRLSLDSLDQKKQVLRFTLITYLASKDLRKDAEGVNRLSDTDIRNIENGINKYDYDKFQGLRSQIEDFTAGLQRYIDRHDPNSGSMVQRFEYWRTSLLIIRQHPLIGVGTGDLPQAFEEQYSRMNTNLASQNRLRSHDQYLSITVAFGIIGLIWFMYMMFYPGIKTRSFSNYFYLIFWLIFMLSMLTEDTIESQEGVTFYVLLTALMLLGREKTESSESVSG